MEQFELEVFLEKENKKANKRFLFWITTTTIISGAVIIGMFYIFNQISGMF